MSARSSALILRAMIAATLFAAAVPGRSLAQRQENSTVRELLSISSASAATAVEAALAEAQRRSVNVCVVILDEAGRFMAGRCMDDVTNASFDVALAKARHSANFRRPTSFQEDLLINRNALQILSIPGMLPLEGGLPLEYEGRQIGAVGVSGAASEVDGAIAAAAKGALQSEGATGSSRQVPQGR